MLRFIWLLIPCFLCCSRPPAEPLPPSFEPQTRVIDAPHLRDIGEYTRAVNLEITDDSLLGNIEKVIVDPTNGDLVLADLKATKSVYRFDENGAFKHRLGGLGAGPGEYETVLDFAVRPNGSVALLTTFKLMLFDSQGTWQREIRHRLTGLRVSALGEDLYVYGIDHRNREAGIVWTFGSDLGVKKAFHPMEPRLRKALFIPRDLMATGSGRLFVGEPYELGFTIYEEDGRVRRMRIPSENPKLEQTWATMTSGDRKTLDKIAAGLHRMETIHAFGDWVHFTEIARAGEVLRSNLLHLPSNTLYRYQGARILVAPNDAPYLSVNGIAGAFDNGVIGVIHDPEKLARYRETHPALANVSFKDSDNPLLLFFTFKLPGQPEQGGKTS